MTTLQNDQDRPPASPLKRKSSVPADAALLDDEESPFRQAFKNAVGEIYISPVSLDPVREISDRALVRCELLGAMLAIARLLGSQTCIVEEARWYNDEEDEDKFVRVIVKTFRPNMIVSNAELDELLEECKRISALDHE